VTVAELIEELKKFPKDAVIVNYNDGLPTTDNIVVEYFEGNRNEVVIW
jgi:hypothetical protein